MGLASGKFGEVTRQGEQSKRVQGAERTLPSALDTHQSGGFELVKVVRDRGRDALGTGDVAADFASRRVIHRTRFVQHGPAPAVVCEKLNDLQPVWVGERLERAKLRFVLHRKECSTRFDLHRNDVTGWLPRRNRLVSAGTFSSVTSFGPVAPYYDELMKQVPYRMWISYYLLLLAHQGVKPRRVLDVCCGTGTMCELLTKEGFEMAGFDLSPGMIAEARRKAEAKGLPIRYEVQDAAEADMGDTYDGALSFFDSLNNILDAERLQMAFHRVAAHLPPGGSFIFDMNTAYAFEQQMFDQQHLKPTSKLRYKWEGHWDGSTRIITVDMKFWYEGQEFTEVHRQRAYSQDEIRQMLSNAGFVEVRAFHSYTLNPPRHSSDRLHWMCERGS